MTLLEKYKQDKKGNVSVLFAGSVSLLLLVTGFAVNNFSATSKKLTTQDLLDNATLAFALSMQDSPNESADYHQQVAESMFHFDNRFGDTGISSLEFSISQNGLEAVGEAEILHLNPFGGLGSKQTRTLQVNSAVGFAAEATAPPCIIALDTNATPGLLLNSGAEIVAEECEVHVHSTRNSALIVNHGTTLESSRVCVASDHVNTQGQTLDNLEKSCDVAPDPFVGRFPVPDLSCDFNNGNYNDSQITLQPGVYCGWHNFNNSNADIEFEAGTYVIRNGGWNINGGDIEAHGVTFYFADNSRIQFNSGVKASIIAPASGDYAGIAFTERPGLGTSDLSFNSSRGFDVTGVFYLPSRNVIWNADSQIDGIQMNFIVNRLVVNQAEIDIAASSLMTGSSTSGGSVSSEAPPYISK